MKFLFPLLLICISFSAFAQNTSTTPEIDERLYEVYDADYLQRLQTANPFLLQRWNFFLDNAWKMKEYTAEKSAHFPEIEVADMNNFNIFLVLKEQKMERPMNRSATYRIKGTNQLLVLHSEKKFTKMLNEHLGRTY